MGRTARRGRWPALAPPECWESIVTPRHSLVRVRDRMSRLNPTRTLAATVASLAVVGGTLAVYGTTDVGVAPAADTVLHCTDTWTGNGGTTAWGTAGNWSTGVPNDTNVDACIPDAATVVVANASFSVGELTVSRGSTLAVGGPATGDSGAPGASLSVSSGLENDGTLTAGPSGSGLSTLSLNGPITNDGVLEVAGGVTIGNTNASNLTNTGTVGVAPGGVLFVAGSSTLSNASQGLLAFGIDGPPTSPSDYGRITNGSLVLGGTVASVLDNGFTPGPGAEYVVDDGPSSGTFSTVLNDAKVDYSHPGEIGLVGGAPDSATTVAVSSSAPMSAFGQGVQFTATVSPSSESSSPTGWVSFHAGAVVLGSAPVVTANGVSTATLDTSNLPVGSGSITAAYGGDLFDGAATSPALTQVVNPDSSNLTIAPSLTSPVPNQPVTYTMTVSPAAPGAGTPAGTVSLTDDGIPAAGCQSLTLPSSGLSQVTCSETYGSDATHSIVATYSGDTDFLTATALVDETVAPESSTTSVSVSSSTLTYGEAVSFTATVDPTTATAAPTGSVSFTDNGAALGTSVLTTTEGVTTTSMLTTTLPLGSNAIAATYGGNIDFAASSSPTPVPVTVSQAPTDLGLGSSLNPAISGQPVTFTASVFPATGSGETGTVTFFAGGIAVGSASVSNGQAALTTVSLPVGNDAVTATYSGDRSFAGSGTPSPWSQEVDPLSG